MKNKNDKLMSIVFLTWFFGTFICIFLTQTNTYLQLLLFGQAFFVFGLVALFSMNITREDYPILLFILVGFTLIEIGLVGIINIEYLNKMMQSVIANSIMLFGLLIMMFEKTINLEKEDYMVLKQKTKDIYVYINVLIDIILEI